MPTIEINEIEYQTYATVEDADNYLSVKYGSQWMSFDEDKKKKLIVSATREIDKREYQGAKIDDAQPLKFPRIIRGEQTDDILVMQACIELADTLSQMQISSSISGVNTEAIKSMKVGDTQIQFRDDVQITSGITLDDVIAELLKPYFKGGNIEIWL